jgi:hypothetical protein
MMTETKKTVMGMPMHSTPMDEPLPGSILQLAWIPRLRVGAVAELRHMSHERIAAIAGNPTIDAGSKVEIQDLHWTDGVRWASVVVVESARAEQVGACACMPVGWLKVEVSAQ